MNQVKLLHNSEINTSKWDECITKASNSRVYALSWYLDIINPDWFGIIHCDYNYVMPVVQSKKYGIRYCYQPTYCQQHGVFPPPSPSILNDVILCLKSKCNYFDISMNSMNSVNDDQLEISNFKNHLLSLNHSIVDIRNNYNAHARRYVKKAGQMCEVNSLVSLDDFLALKIKNANKGYSRANHHTLKLIIHKALSQNRGKIYGAYSDKNELVAAAFFLFENKRYTYLSSVSSAEGKKRRAMYLVIDKFIEDHDESIAMLDFEGSTIQGIARFFEGFGAKPELYQHIKYNNLPWPIKLLKE